MRRAFEDGVSRNRRRPFGLQRVDVGRRDLFQRGVVRALVVAPEHRPVLRFSGRLHQTFEADAARDVGRCFVGRHLGTAQRCEVRHDVVDFPGREAGCEGRHERRRIDGDIGDLHLVDEVQLARRVDHLQRERVFRAADAADHLAIELLDDDGDRATTAATSAAATTSARCRGRRAATGASRLPRGRLRPPGSAAGRAPPLRRRGRRRSASAVSTGRRRCGPVCARGCGRAPPRHRPPPRCPRPPPPGAAAFGSRIFCRTMAGGVCPIAERSGPTTPPRPFTWWQVEHSALPKNNVSPLAAFPVIGNRSRVDRRAAGGRQALDVGHELPDLLVRKIRIGVHFRARHARPDGVEDVGIFAAVLERARVQGRPAGVAFSDRAVALRADLAEDASRRPGSRPGCPPRG